MDTEKEDPQTFQVAQLPDYDRGQIERGNCPWCAVKVVDATLYGGQGAQCPECLDEFV